ncbi:hypothetical protein MMC16_001554 [Acarospora aff. strigata]|nr:hypothetical protein [Acarospora aff. strigata]
MAARRIPSSFKPVFFGPPGAPPGTIICPFVITYGNCEVKIQCSQRVRTKWLTVQNVAALLVLGLPVPQRDMQSGCVKHLGIGGVATARYVNDPLWIEVKEVGVPGPQQGTAAPLLKGIGIEHRLKPADEPLPDGWYPLGESGSGSESWPRLDLSTE